MDCLWANSPIHQKQAIAEELAKKSERLRGDRYGSFQWRNTGISMFLRSRQEWKAFQIQQEKRRQMFDSLVADEGNIHLLYNMTIISIYSY